MVFDSCTLVFADKPPVLTSMVQYWTEQGLSLRNPGNGKITVLDNEGNQVEINSVYSLDEQLPIAIQLWLSSDTDLLITIQKQWDLWVENYFFDGLCEDNRRDLIAKLANRMTYLTSQTSIMGVIYDYKNRLADRYVNNFNI